MREESYYELLQVSENADQEIIQAAWRRLVLRYHPDRSSDPNAAEMTQRLNDAYAILSDPARRAEYDRELAAGPSSRPAHPPRPPNRPTQETPPPRPKQPPPPPRASQEQNFREDWGEAIFVFIGLILFVVVVLLIYLALL